LFIEMELTHVFGWAGEEAPELVKGKDTPVCNVLRAAVNGPAAEGGGGTVKVTYCHALGALTVYEDR
jgi:hypothetical protein